ncbi:MAG TPA: L,D-transpeptidase family protein [Bacteroidia bacterium]|nr:L,D-transpeptidase family protein [Bacteroidia bacterium]
MFVYINPVMKTFIVFILACGFVAAFVFIPPAHTSPPPNNGFRAQQKKIARVRTAYELKWPGIREKLHSMAVDSNAFQLFIRIFKEEAEVEAWVKSAKNPTFKLFTTYPICAGSGTLGPKRCQGDNQVPEGFYHIYVFNPHSNYHLSLGVSYPNASDNYFACKRDAGGAIMIHGNCVTIGCVPITDDLIRELYVLAAEAKNGGQNEIPIHIFPARLSEKKLGSLKNDYPDKATHALWDNLREGYEPFEKNKLLPVVRIDAKGKYLFK